MNRDSLGQALYAAAHREGQFVLRSGRMTTEYFDKYRFEADPRLLRQVAEALAPLVPGDTDALAGLELGGIPIATALGLVTQLPIRFVRKAPKAYGTCQLVEGGEIAGVRLLVVEDVVTTGGQVVQAAESLRELGARVEHAVCVIDREAGGPKTLRLAGIGLAALYRIGELQ